MSTQDINLSKSLEFFDPAIVKSKIHILGCGAVGSTIAEGLARLGIEELHLWDFDIVEPKNVANQMFTSDYIGVPKVEALADICSAIHPGCKIVLHPEGYKNESLSGYIFLCIDNIDVVRGIVEAQKHNPYIKAMFNFRMRLTDAQHYAADWSNEKQKDDLLASMQFSHEEALAETPVSACHTTLNVHYTVRIICSLGIANFVNFVRKNEIQKVMLIELENFLFDFFK